jgi:hypothetical protein
LTTKPAARLAEPPATARTCRTSTSSRSPTSVIHDARAAVAIHMVTAADYGTKIFRFQNLVNVANTSLLMESPSTHPNLPGDARRALAERVPHGESSRRCLPQLRQRASRARSRDVAAHVDPSARSQRLEGARYLADPGVVPRYHPRPRPEHYFASPRVHVRVFRRMFGNRVGGADPGPRTRPSRRSRSGRRRPSTAETPRPRRAPSAVIAP